MFRYVEVTFLTGSVLERYITIREKISDVPRLFCRKLEQIRIHCCIVSNMNSRNVDDIIYARCRRRSLHDIVRFNRRNQSPSCCRVCQITVMPYALIPINWLFFIEHPMHFKLRVFEKKPTKLVPIATAPQIKIFLPFFRCSNVSVLAIINHFKALH